MRAGFYAAVLATLLLALGPPAYSPVVVNDKIEHLVGFFVLTLLGIAAFGGRRALGLTLALVSFGAAIEILQMLPFIGRDGEMLDWLADFFYLPEVVYVVILV